MLRELIFIPEESVNAPPKPKIVWNFDVEFILKVTKNKKEKKRKERIY